MKTLLWIVVAVVVIAVIVAVVMSQSRKKREESNRVEATQLRDTSADHHLKLQEQEASAAGAEADARKVRAEADQRGAEAKRLEVEAQRRDQDRDMAREEHESTLRRADALDPDVRSDKEGYRLDDDGNRVDDGPTPPRPAAPVHEGSGREGATAADRAPLGRNEPAQADNRGPDVKGGVDRERGLDREGGHDGGDDTPGNLGGRREADGDGHPG